VALVITYVSEERIASIIRVTKIGMLGIGTFSETSVLTRAKRRNIPENCILRSHRRKILRSYNLIKHYAMKAYGGVDI
jgi:hypothetical protein